MSIPTSARGDHCAATMPCSAHCFLFDTQVPRDIAVLPVREATYCPQRSPCITSANDLRVEQIVSKIPGSVIDISCVEVECLIPDSRESTLGAKLFCGQEASSPFPSAG